MAGRFTRQVAGRAAPPPSTASSSSPSPSAGTLPPLHTPISTPTSPSKQVQSTFSPPLPPPDPPDPNSLPNPLPENLQCKRTTKTWRCPLPILIGGGGMCTKHISKTYFQVITTKPRGKIKEAKAQSMVEEKCSMVGGFFFAPPPSSNKETPSKDSHEAISQLPSSPNLIVAPSCKVGLAQAVSTHGARQNVPLISYKEALNQHGLQDPQTPPPDFEVAPKCTTFKDGDPAFIMTEEELEDSMKTCKWHAVIRFPHENPPIVKVREIVNFKWELEHYATVGILNIRHVLVKASSEVDFQKVLDMDAHKILNVNVKIFKWSSNFTSQRESPLVHRWIRLPSLPSNYFAPSGLEGIGNAISKFVMSDKRSLTKENPGYGRICIELDLSKPLPSRVWIGTSLDKGFWQRIVVEGRIDYCSHCGLHGHTLSVCRKAAAEPNATSGMVVDTRTYCARCRMNNHATSECRWINQAKEASISRKFCEHCKKTSHNKTECWSLQRIGRHAAAVASMPEESEQQTTSVAVSAPSCSELIPEAAASPPANLVSQQASVPAVARVNNADAVGSIPQPKVSSVIAPQLNETIGCAADQINVLNGTLGCAAEPTSVDTSVPPSGLKVMQVFPNGADAQIQETHSGTSSTANQVVTPPEFSELFGGRQVPSTVLSPLADPFYFPVKERSKEMEDITRIVSSNSFLRVRSSDNITGIDPNLFRRGSFVNQSASAINDTSSEGSDTSDINMHLFDI